MGTRVFKTSLPMETLDICQANGWRLMFPPPLKIPGVPIFSTEYTVAVQGDGVPDGPATCNAPDPLFVTKTAGKFTRLFIGWSGDETDLVEIKSGKE